MIAPHEHPNEDNPYEPYDHLSRVSTLTSRSSYTQSTRRSKKSDKIKRSHRGNDRDINDFGGGQELHASPTIEGGNAAEKEITEHSSREEDATKEAKDHTEDEVAADPIPEMQKTQQKQPARPPTQAPTQIPNITPHEIPTQVQIQIVAPPMQRTPSIRRTQSTHSDHSQKSVKMDSSDIIAKFGCTEGKAIIDILSRHGGSMEEMIGASLKELKDIKVGQQVGSQAGPGLEQMEGVDKNEAIIKSSDGKDLEIVDGSAPKDVDGDDDEDSPTSSSGSTTRRRGRYYQSLQSSKRLGLGAASRSKDRSRTGLSSTGLRILKQKSRFAMKRGSAEEEKNASAAAAAAGAVSVSSSSKNDSSPSTAVVTSSHASKLTTAASSTSNLMRNRSRRLLSKKMKRPSLKLKKTSMMNPSSLSSWSMRNMAYRNASIAEEEEEDLLDEGSEDGNVIDKVVVDIVGSNRNRNTKNDNNSEMIDNESSKEESNVDGSANNISAEFKMDTKDTDDTKDGKNDKDLPGEILLNDQLKEEESQNAPTGYATLIQKMSSWNSTTSAGTKDTKGTKDNQSVAKSVKSTKSVQSSKSIKSSKSHKDSHGDDGSTASTTSTANNTDDSSNHSQRSSDSDKFKVAVQVNDASHDDSMDANGVDPTQDPASSKDGVEDEDEDEAGTIVTEKCSVKTNRTKQSHQQKQHHRHNSTSEQKQQQSHRRNNSAPTNVPPPPGHRHQNSASSTLSLVQIIHDDYHDMEAIEPQLIYNDYHNKIFNRGNNQDDGIEVSIGNAGDDSPEAAVTDAVRAADPVTEDEKTAGTSPKNKERSPSFKSLSSNDGTMNSSKDGSRDKKTKARKTKQHSVDLPPRVPVNPATQAATAASNSIAEQPKNAHRRTNSNATNSTSTSSPKVQRKCTHRRTSSSASNSTSPTIRTAGPDEKKDSSGSSIGDEGNHVDSTMNNTESDHHNTEASNLPPEMPRLETTGGKLKRLGKLSVKSLLHKRQNETETHSTDHEGEPGYSSSREGRTRSKLAAVGAATKGRRGRSRSRSRSLSRGRSLSKGRSLSRPRRWKNGRNKDVSSNEATSIEESGMIRNKANAANTTNNAAEFVPSTPTPSVRTMTKDGHAVGLSLAAKSIVHEASVPQATGPFTPSYLSTPLTQVIISTPTSHKSRKSRKDKNGGSNFGLSEEAKKVLAGDELDIEVKLDDNGSHPNDKNVSGKTKKKRKNGKEKNRVTTRGSKPSRFNSDYYESESEYSSEEDSDYESDDSSYTSNSSSSYGSSTIKSSKSFTSSYTRETFQTHRTEQTDYSSPCIARAQCKDLKHIHDLQDLKDITGVTAVTEAVQGSVQAVQGFFHAIEDTIREAREAMDVNRTEDGDLLREVRRKKASERKERNERSERYNSSERRCRSKSRHDDRAREDSGSFEREKRRSSSVHGDRKRSTRTSQRKSSRR